MPELPEVEVVRRGIENLVQDHPAIVSFKFLRKDLRDPIPTRALEGLVGAKIDKIMRRAKYLFIVTSKGAILSHLGMTGNWRNEPAESLRTHDHIIMRLSNGVTLIYSDPRRFGMFELVRGEIKNSTRIKNLGPEPLEDSFAASYLFQKSRKRQICIKTFIMDQKNVVGVGNIYASEALFRAGVRPTKKAAKVSLQECERLVCAIRVVLEEAIQAGGSSIQDFRSTQQESGYFQTKFAVYDRAGEPCVKCATPIKSQVIGGRNSFWCSSCQS